MLLSFLLLLLLLPLLLFYETQINTGDDRAQPAAD
jgi:hypothetical protein